MEKFQELVKEGKLSKTLMADKGFIDGAKEIFKSENVGMDDNKLLQLMNEIESQLKRGNVLDDEALEQVSGGIAEYDIERGIVKTVTTVVKTVATSVADNTIVADDMKIASAILGGYTGGAAGALVGGSGGKEAIAGAVLGYKFGNWICKKAGIKESQN